jgi:ABC-type lipoprotein release transport system permease subunit
MVINRANMLQGLYLGVIGGLSLVIVGFCAWMLLPYLMPLAPAKAGYDEFRVSPVNAVMVSNLIVSVSTLLVFVTTYWRLRRNMRMNLPAWIRVAMFALGASVTANVGLLAYLWAQSWT